MSKDCAVRACPLLGLQTQRYAPEDPAQVSFAWG